MIDCEILLAPPPIRRNFFLLLIFVAKRVPHLDRSLTSADTLTPSDGRRRFHATVLFVFVLSVFFSFYSASFIAAFLSTLEGLVVVPFYDRNSPFESVCLSFFSFFFEGGVFCGRAKMKPH